MPDKEVRIRAEALSKRMWSCSNSRLLSTVRKNEILTAMLVCYSGDETVYWSSMRHSKNSTSLIVFLLVGVLSFSFLHSELGLLDCDMSNHGLHDYCQLVDAGTNRVERTSAPAIQKPTVVKHICFHCINEHSTRIQETLFRRVEQPLLKVPPSQDITLENCVFLI